MDKQPPPRIDYRVFLESTPLVPWELDPCSHKLSYVGPQAVAFLGHPLEEWLDPDFWDKHVVPDDQVALQSARARLNESGGSHVVEYRMEHADGRILWVSEAATAVEQDGSFCCLRGMLSDITEHKRLEGSLAQSEERLRALLRSAPDAMIFTETDGAILNMNDQARYLFGYTLDEIQGSSIDLLVPERLRPRMPGQRAAFDRDPQRQTLVDGVTTAVQRRDGEEVAVELSISLVQFGGHRQLMYAVRDVSARRRVEDQLAASQRRLRGMGEALPGLVSFIDSDQRYRFVNESYAIWAGWHRDEMEGRTVREVLGDAVHATLEPAIQRALAGHEVRFRAEIGGIPGDDTPVDITYVPYIDGEGVAGYFVIVVDVDPAGDPPPEVHDLTNVGAGATKA